jgi:AcrR family transcriptional regulator
MLAFDWSQIQLHILQLEQEGLVTRTFRRLDADRQQAVITAILDEAIEKGPPSINIKRVAERASVSVGSLYTYFGNREGLLNFAVALVVRYINGTFDSYRPYLAAMPLHDGLIGYVGGGIQWSETQMGLLQFFARAAYHGESELSEKVVRPIAETLLMIVRDMLKQAIERGEVRADIDFEATARIIHALTIVVGDSQIFPFLNNYFQITGGDVPIERTAEALVSLIFNGIGRK